LSNGNVNSGREIVLFPKELIDPGIVEEDFKVFLLVVFEVRNGRSDLRVDLSPLTFRELQKDNGPLFNNGVDDQHAPDDCEDRAES